jgi:gas vesicle protein
LRSPRSPPRSSFFAFDEQAFYDAWVTIEVAFEGSFACAVLLAAAALAGAALERAEKRLLLGTAGATGAAAAAAWVAFALRPELELAISATGLMACLVAIVGALALRRGMEHARAVERDIERVKAELDAVVQRELRERSADLERGLARGRADSLSAYAEEERRLAETRRTALGESEQRLRHGLAEAFSKVQGQVEQRLAAWQQDLDRAQRQLGGRLEQIAARERSLIEALEARLASDAERLKTADEEQRAAVARLREDLGRAGKEAAAAAAAELEAHATDRRRALHQVAERLSTRERDLVRRIEREETDASRRIQSTFADVERRQVEQLERVLDRAAGRFVDAAAHQFEGTVKAAQEEAARRLSRELERAVQSFAREGESLLADRLGQVGDAGGMRLEKKLAQVAAGLERQREEFVASLGRRLGEVESEFRERLATLAGEEAAERAALEARLAEIARRIDLTVSQAEERLDSLHGSAH